MCIYVQDFGVVKMVYGIYVKLRSLRWFNTINVLIMCMFFVACLYPFYYIFITSISSPVAVARGFYLIPTKVSFSTYDGLFRRNDIIGAFIVSVSRTVIGTLITIFLSSFFAFLATKPEMMFRKFIYRFIIVSMYINAGLIPWYITMRMYGLQNNFFVYIVPGALNAYFIILVKTFIEQLPPSLEESASLDGANLLTIFLFIIVPLSKPILATIAVYAAVGQWNSWMDNFFLVRNKNLQTIQLILYNYMDEAQRIAQNMQQMSGAGGFAAAMPDRILITPVSVKMAATVVTVFPIMLVYPFLQKYFVKGIMMGAIKG